jgi:hypothetical protein
MPQENFKDKIRYDNFIDVQQMTTEVDQRD